MVDRSPTFVRPIVEPSRDRLHDQRQPELGHDAHPVSRGSRDRWIARRPECPSACQTSFVAPLVHRQRRGHHAAAGVGIFSVSSAPCTRAVLAEASVQRDEDARRIRRALNVEHVALGRVERVRVDALLDAAPSAPRCLTGTRSRARRSVRPSAPRLCRTRSSSFGLPRSRALRARARYPCARARLRAACRDQRLDIGRARVPRRGFTMKLACFSETSCVADRVPLSPHCSISRGRVVAFRIGGRRCRHSAARAAASRSAARSSSRMRRALTVSASPGGEA